jgi:hypothetical protein
MFSFSPVTAFIQKNRADIQPVLTASFVILFVAGALLSVFQHRSNPVAALFYLFFALLPFSLLLAAPKFHTFSSAGSALYLVLISATSLSAGYGLFPSHHVLYSGLMLATLLLAGFLALIYFATRSRILDVFISSVMCGFGALVVGGEILGLIPRTTGGSVMQPLIAIMLIGSFKLLRTYREERSAASQPFPAV